MDASTSSLASTEAETVIERTSLITWTCRRRRGPNRTELDYLMSLATAASIFSLISSASSFDHAFLQRGFGTPSTSSLASLRPRGP